MGSAFSSTYKWFYNVKEVKIMMVGLGNSGKTTALYKLKLGEVVTTIPTTGFNVETVHYKNISFTVWDVGWGGGKIRYLWHHYCQDTNAVIFVVDSTDREEMAEAKDCLHSLLSIKNLGKNFVILVLANKQDLSNAMKAEELSHQLDLHAISRPWHIQETCATNGNGLYEGLAWLSNELNKLDAS